MTYRIVPALNLYLIIASPESRSRNRRESQLNLRRGASLCSVRDGLRRNIRGLGLTSHLVNAKTTSVSPEFTAFTIPPPRSCFHTNRDKENEQVRTIYGIWQRSALTSDIVRTDRYQICTLGVGAFSLGVAITICMRKRSLSKRMSEGRTPCQWHTFIPEPQFFSQPHKPKQPNRNKPKTTRHTNPLPTLRRRIFKNTLRLEIKPEF